jgi:uncharacterized membrane protein YecN with MAPEG domain
MLIRSTINNKEYRPIALMLYKLVNFHGAKVWQYTILGNRLILGKWKGVIPIYNDNHKTTIHAQKKNKPPRE